MVRTAIAGFVGVLVGAAVVGVATGQREGATEKVVRAQRFELVNEQGKVSAQLAPFAAGTAALSLRAPDGKVRMHIAVDRSGIPRIEMHDKQGVPRAVLTVSPYGPPFVVLHDENITRRAMLYLAEDGSPQIALRGRDGELLWKAP